MSIVVQRNYQIREPVETHQTARKILMGAQSKQASTFLPPVSCTAGYLPNVGQPEMNTRQYCHEWFHRLRNNRTGEIEWQKKVKGNCTQSQPKEKKLYDAPIRIVNKQDLKNYGITWKDCVRLHIGGIETVNVYMSKTDKPNLANYFWNELNAEHHRNSRAIRCILRSRRARTSAQRCLANASGL